MSSLPILKNVAKLKYSVLITFTVICIAIFTLLIKNCSDYGASNTNDSNPESTEIDARFYRQLDSDARSSHYDTHDAKEQSASANNRSRRNTDSSTSDRPSLLSESGGITTAAVAELGLSELQAKALEKILADITHDVASSLADNTEYLKHESNPDLGLYVYRIRSIGQDHIVQDLQRELSNNIGVEKSNEILDLLATDQFFNYHLAGYGRYDVKLSLFPIENEGQMTTISNFEYFDPSSGRRVSSSSVDMDRLNVIFSGLFDDFHRTYSLDED